MKFIREVNENVQFLKEENDTGDTEYFIEGIFIQSDLQNRNGRIYPSSVMERVVEKYNEEFIARKRSLGELGHPDNPSINLDRASHLIVELRREDSNWIGKAKILDTPNGKIVKSFMKEGIQLGVSSRGLGSIKEIKGTKVVQDDFFFVTAADIVADPSAPEAFVDNLMESTDWVMDATGSWVPQYVKEAKKKVKKEYKKFMTMEEKEALSVQLLEEFLRKL